MVSLNPSQTKFSAPGLARVTGRYILGGRRSSAAGYRIKHKFAVDSGKEGPCHIIHRLLCGTGGTTSGGAAMVATTGDPAEPVIMHTSQIRGAELTSSYYEEKVALLPALDGTRVSCPTDRISICSDSQSLLKAIRSGARDTQFIPQRLDNRKGPPSSSGFRAIRVCQATRLLTN